MINDRSEIDASYYQKLHDNNEAFMKNNWLLSDFDLIKKVQSTKESSILELGCGNGRFLELAINMWSDVTGVDWARSKYIDELMLIDGGLKFIQADVTTLKLDRNYDLIVSADFLEHLLPENLVGVISEALRFGKVNYHKIACYDDGHSHLSIFSPEKWLKLFNSQPGGEKIQIINSELRKKNPNNIIVTLSNVDG